MSQTVDTKVARIELDNKQFESAAKQSSSTLDKLKGGLNFEKQNKALQQLSEQSRKTFLQDMSSSLDTLVNRFENRGIVLTTTIANLTNKLVDMGLNMAKSFTFDPITQGLHEYELQMNAIQTIMANTASKGTTLQEVNNVLDELNVYADKTIYNFAEMTKNIGTFTAAGVGLRDSADSIKGIANLAAMSGSNSQQAATAMYQLSQAMAAGTVKLMDWNSVVNAGMGGETLQNELKATARVHGIAVDEIVAKQGSFRESLKEGWVTTEILTETLKKFTGDMSKADLQAQGYSEKEIYRIQALAKTANDAATKVKTLTQLKDTTLEELGSGWAKSFQLIIGDFNDARNMLTDISTTINNLIAKTSTARNLFLKDAFKGKAVDQDIYGNLKKSVEEAGGSMEQFEALLKKTAQANDSSFDQMMEKAGSFEESLKTGWLNETLLEQAFNNFQPFEFLNAIEEMKSGVGDLGEKFQELRSRASEPISLPDLENLGLPKEQLDGLLDSLQSVAKNELLEYDQLMEEYGSWENVLLRSGKITGDMLGKAVDDWSEITKAELEAQGYTEDEIAQMKELANASGETRGQMQSLFDEVRGGRKLLVEAIGNIAKFIGSILKPISDAWKTVFPPQMGSAVRDLFAGFNKLTASLKLSEEAQKGIKNTFMGIFAVLHAGTRIVGTIAKVIGSVLVVAVKTAIQVINPFISVITSITGTVGSLVAAFERVVPPWKAFYYGLISSNLGGFVSAMKDLASAMGGKLLSAIEALSKPFNRLSGYFNEIDSAGLTNMFYALGKAVGDFLGKLDVSSVKEFSKSLREGFKDFKMENIVKDFGAIFSGMFASIKSVFQSGIDYILSIDYSQVYANFKRSLEKVISGLGAAVKRFVNFIINPIQTAYAAEADYIDRIDNSQNHIKETFNTIEKDISSIGDKIKESFNRAFSFFGDWGKSFSDMFKRLVDGFNWDELGILISDGIMSSMIVVVRNYHKLFSSILPALTEGLSGALKGIGKIFSGLGGILKGFEYDLKADAIKKIAEAILIIAGAMWVLSQIPDMEKACNGLIAVGAAMIMMSVGLRILMKAASITDLKATFGKKGFTLNKSGIDFAGIALAMTAMAGGMLILATACAKFSKDVTDEGFSRAVGALTGMTVVLYALSNMKLNPSIAASLIAISASLLFMARAIENLGKIDFVKFGKNGEFQGFTQNIQGLVLAIGLMAGMTGSLYIIGKSGAAASTGMVGMAKGLLALAPALLLFRFVGVEGVTAFAATLTVLGVFAKQMQKMGMFQKRYKEVGDVFQKMAVDLRALAPALAMIAGALAAVTIASSFGDITQGLILFAGGLTILGVAAKAVQEFNLDVGLERLGKAMVSFVKPISSLVKAVGILALGLSALAMAITPLIGFTPVLPAFGKALGETFGGLVGGLMDGLKKAGPSIKEGLIEFLSAVIEALVANAEILISGLASLTDQAVENLIRLFMNHGKEFVDAASAMITNVLTALKEHGEEWGRLGSEGAINFIHGFTQGIHDNRDKIYSSIHDVFAAAPGAAGAGISALPGFDFFDWSSGGQEALGSIALGAGIFAILAKHLGSFKNAAGAAKDGMISLRDTVKGISETGTHIKNVTSTFKNFGDKIGNLTKPLQRFRKGAKDAAEGGKVIKEGTKQIKEATDTVKGGTGIMNSGFFTNLGSGLGAAAKALGTAGAVVIVAQNALGPIADFLNQLRGLKSEEATAAAVGLAGVLGALTTCMILLSKFATSNSKLMGNVKKGKKFNMAFDIGDILNLVAVSAALAIAAQAMKPIAEALNTLRDYSVEDRETAIVALTLSLGVIVGALITLSNFIGDKLDDLMKLGMAAGLILAASAAIALIGWGLGQIPEMDFIQVAVKLVAIGGAIAEMTAIALALGALVSGGTLGIGAAMIAAGVVTVLGLAAAIGAIAVALQEVCKVNFKGLSPKIDALKEILDKLSECLTETDIFSGIAKNFQGSAIAAASEALGNIADALVKMESINADTILPKVTSLSVILDKLGEVINNGNFWDNLTKGATADALNKSTESVEKITNTLNALNNIPLDTATIDTKIDKVKELLDKLAGLMIYIANNDAKNKSKSAAESLDNISSAALNIANALSVLSGIKTDDANKAKTALEGMLNAIRDCLTDAGYINDDVEKLGTAISNASGALGNIASALNATAAVDTDTADQKIYAIGELLKKLNEQVTDWHGFAGIIKDKGQAIADASGALPHIAESIAKLADAKLDADAVVTSATAIGNVLVTMGNAFAQINTTFFDFFKVGGGADFSLASQMGKAVKDLADSIKILNEIQIKENLGTDLENAINQIKESLSNAGGLTDEQNNIVTQINDTVNAINDGFEALKECGKGLGEKVAEGVNEAKSTLYKCGEALASEVRTGIENNAGDASAGVQKISDSLSSGLDGIHYVANEGGKALASNVRTGIESNAEEALQGAKQLGEQFMLGLRDLEQFDFSLASQMDKAVIDLADSIKILNEIQIKENLGDDLKTAIDKIKSALEESGELSDTQKTLVDQIDSAVQAINNGWEKLKECGKGVGENFASGIGDSFNTVQEQGKALASNVQTGVESNSWVLKDAASTMVDNFGTALDGKHWLAQECGKALASNVQTGVEAQKDVLWKAGSSLADKFIEGLKWGENGVKNAGEGLGSKAVEGIGNKYGSAYDAGWNIAMGLKDGMYDDRAVAIVKRVASDLGTVAIEAMKEAAGISSPSRLTMEMGRYLVEGLSLGLRDRAAISSLYEVATNLGESVTEIINDTIDSDVDLSPVITPVVDLTDLQNGINSMPNTIGINGGLMFDSINAGYLETMNPTSMLTQNMMQLLTEMQTANKRVSEAENATYNLNLGEGIIYQGTRASDIGAYVTETLESASKMYV